MSPTAKKLPADEGKWEINLPEDDGSSNAKGRMFTIQIRFTRSIDIGKCSPTPSKSNSELIRVE